MVSAITISPSGAGSASYTSREETGYYYVDSSQYHLVRFEKTIHELSAVANDGYEFSHFEIKRKYYTIPQSFDPVITTFILNNNEETYEIVNHHFYGGTYRDDDCTEIIDITAVFIKKIRVIVSVSPEKAGEATGGGYYTVGDSCTISARPKCSLWIFDHWKFSSGSIYSEKSVTFDVSEDVTCTAFFRHENTGELIFDADGSGDLIMGDGGSLLYNGDLVTA